MELGHRVPGEDGRRVGARCPGGGRACVGVPRSRGRRPNVGTPASPAWRGGTARQLQGSRQSRRRRRPLVLPARRRRPQSSPEVEDGDEAEMARSPGMLAGVARPAEGVAAAPEVRAACMAEEAGVRDESVSPSAGPAEGAAAASAGEGRSTMGSSARGPQPASMCLLPDWPALSEGHGRTGTQRGAIRQCEHLLLYNVRSGRRARCPWRRVGGCGM